MTDSLNLRSNTTISNDGRLQHHSTTVISLQLHYVVKESKINNIGLTMHSRLMT